MASLNPIQVTTSGFSAATGQIVKITAKNICTLSDKVLNFVQTYYYWGSNSGTLANLLTAFLDPTKSAYAKGMALVHSDLNKTGGAIGTVTVQSLTSPGTNYATGVALTGGNLITGGRMPSAACFCINSVGSVHARNFRSRVFYGPLAEGDVVSDNLKTGTPATNWGAVVTATSAALIDSAPITWTPVIVSSLGQPPKLSKQATIRNLVRENSGLTTSSTKTPAYIKAFNVLGGTSYTVATMPDISMNKYFSPIASASIQTEVVYLASRKEHNRRNFGRLSAELLQAIEGNG